MSISSRCSSIFAREIAFNFFPIIFFSLSSRYTCGVLEKLQTLGSNQRVTKKDILNYVSSGKKLNSTEAIAKTNQPIINTPKTIHTISGQDEIIEMDRMRKLIADHMVNSVNTAPHVTSFVEADVTNLVLWRNKTKKRRFLFVV